MAHHVITTDGASLYVNGEVLTSDGRSMFLNGRYNFRHDEPFLSGDSTWRGRHSYADNAYILRYDDLTTSQRALIDDLQVVMPGYFALAHHNWNAQPQMSMNRQWNNRFRPDVYPYKRNSNYSLNTVLGPDGTFLRELIFDHVANRTSPIRYIRIRYQDVKFLHPNQEPFLEDMIEIMDNNEDTTPMREYSRVEAEFRQLPRWKQELLYTMIPFQPPAITHGIPGSTIEQHEAWNREYRQKIRDMLKLDDLAYWTPNQRAYFLHGLPFLHDVWSSMHNRELYEAATLDRREPMNVDVGQRRVMSAVLRAGEVFNDHLRHVYERKAAEEEVKAGVEETKGEVSVKKRRIEDIDD